MQGLYGLFEKNPPDFFLKSTFFPDSLLKPNLFKEFEDPWLEVNHNKLITADNTNGTKP